MIKELNVKPNKMIYPIHIYGSPALRTQAEEIDSDHPEIGKLIEDMFETMYHSNGVGLAAPQIGEVIRLFIVDVRQYADEHPELSDFKRVFINPDIYAWSEEECLMEEGCLSVPGLNDDVVRPEAIKIRYLDENFVEHDEQIEGYAARVIQHEYDHLDGKMFVDHLKPIRKSMLRNKLSAMSRGKFEASYKTRLK